jgi:hypothetical protein
MLISFFSLATAGRFFKELWDDSLVLAPFEPRAGKALAPTMTSPEEAVTGHMQIGVVDHDGADTRGCILLCEGFGY